MLLANAVFFMWEYKSGFSAINTELDGQIPLPGYEQIALLGELQQAASDKPLPNAENKHNETTALPTDEASNVTDTHNIDKNKVVANNSPLHAVDAQGQPQIPQTPQDDLNSQTQLATEPSTNQATLNTNDKQENAKPPACYEVGPFANNGEYQAWVKGVAIKVLDSRPIYKNGDVITGYLVFFPAGSSIEQSQEHAQALRDKGIKDLWLIRNGEDKGLISLGMFKTEVRAKSMKDQLLSQGITAEVKPKYKPGKQPYAQIKINAETINELKTALGPALQIFPISCW